MYLALLEPYIFTQGYTLRRKGIIIDTICSLSTFCGFARLPNRCSDRLREQLNGFALRASEDGRKE